ncbi:MAG TPA: D-glucuronyl C5-epimerase family protein [Gaiellaceae bacterium]
MRRAFAAALAVAIALAPTAAGARANPDSKLAKQGLDRSVKLGALTPEDANAYRAEVERAVRVLPKLGGSRYTNLAAVLHEVATQWRAYSAPRALTLFSMLATNTTYFGNRITPPPGRDVTDDDGIVYRFFPGHGFQFHPLANAGALNSAVALKDAQRTAALATALVARASTGPNDSLLWEYEWPFGGGKPPWTSGMAQAVMAQALTRAAELTGDTSFTDAAARAFRAIPGALVRRLPAGPWIRLYSFDGAAVLNAQLQSAISLADYATATGDADAAALAAALQSSAEALLPRFDTGYWSLYQLGGGESPLEYHVFVVSLLKKLAQRNPTDPFWADTAARFDAYTTEPPLLRAGAAPPTLFPRPADGYRDVARISFWLSKISRVTLSAGGRATTLTLSRGNHTLTWSPGSLRPGTYAARLTAVDLAKNSASLDLPPIDVEWDTLPPSLDAWVTGRTLEWVAEDEGTPWLDLRVLLSRGVKRRQLTLGHRPLEGKAVLRLPPGPWTGVLTAANSAGKVARAELGTLPAPE